MFVCRIRELRIAKGWSQDVLARKINMSQTEISNLELNKKSTTLTTLDKLSEAFDCCVYDIFYFKCHRYKKCKKLNKNCLNCNQLINQQE